MVQQASQQATAQIVGIIPVAIASTIALRAAKGIPPVRRRRAKKRKMKPAKMKMTRISGRSRRVR